jgi:hypothetical protein
MEEEFEDTKGVIRKNAKSNKILKGYMWRGYKNSSWLNNGLPVYPGAFTF